MDRHGHTKWANWFLLSFLFHAGFLLLLLSLWKVTPSSEKEFFEDSRPAPVSCTLLVEGNKVETARRVHPAAPSAALHITPRFQRKTLTDARAADDSQRKTSGIKISSAAKGRSNIPALVTAGEDFFPSPATSTSALIVEESYSENSVSFQSASKEDTSESAPPRTATSQPPFFSEPILLIKSEAAYPPIARQNEWDGSVVVEISVSSEGTPEECKIIATSGHPALDQAALEAARKTKFRPASQEGKPVVCLVSLTYSFNFNSR
ncbi:MAG: energy transducer TonB [bacterium]